MAYRPSSGGYRPGAGYRPGGGGYRAPGSSAVTQAPQPVVHDGGFLHGLAHAIVQGGKDLYNVAENAPTGVYDTAKAISDAELFLTTGNPAKKEDRSRLKGVENIAKSYGQQVAADVQHPLRHPGYTGLDVLPFISAGAGGALRVAGLAGREGALADAARAATAGGKRTLTFKGDINKAPTVATRDFAKGNIRKAAQVARDVVTERRAAGGSERAQRALERRGEKWIARSERTAEIKANAPAIRFQAAAQALGRGAEGDAKRYALRLVAEQVPLQEREALLKGYRQQAKKAGNAIEAKRHSAKLVLLRNAAKYLDEGENGKPVFKLDPPKKGMVRLYRGEGENYMSYEDQGLTPGDETHYFSPDRAFAAAHDTGGGLHYVDVPEAVAKEHAGTTGVELPGTIAAKAREVGTGAGRLSDAYSRLQEVSDSRDAMLQHLGLMDENALTGAKVKAARFARGARYVKPTRSKLGEFTPVEQSKLARERRLQKQFDALYAKHRGWYETTTRARTQPEAEDRLHALETEHANALDKIAAARYGPIDKAEVARRNAERGKQIRIQARVNKSLGSRGFGSVPTKLRATVKEERRAQVQQDIEAAIARNPDHPTIQQWAARNEEIDRLRSALNPEFGEPVGDLGTVEEHRFISRSPRLENVGAALAKAKEESAQVRAAAARRAKPVGMVGPGEPENFDPFAPYIGNPTERSRWSGRSRAVDRIGKKVKPGSMRVATGAAVRRSIQREDIGKFIPQRHAETVKAMRLFNRIDRLKGAITKAPRSNNDVFVYTDKMFQRQRVPQNVADYFRDPERFADKSPEQKSAMLDTLKTALSVKHDWSLDPEARALFEKDAKEGLGGFVPRSLLGEYADPTPLANFAGTKAGKFLDTLENAQKFAIIYFKVNYPLIQGASNVAMNFIHAGFPAAENLRRASFLSHAIGPELTSLVDAYSGQGFAHQIGIEGQNIISRGTRAYANLASNIADRIPRRAAFLHEADQAGFGTPDKLKALLTEDQHADALHEVSMKTNEAMVDFDNLGPRERSIVRRLIFIYPWVKGSTQWAGRFLGDHPVQAAVLGQLGQRGTAVDQRRFGPEGKPSYLAGSFDIGGRLVNPTSFNPFSTPADLGRTAAAVASGRFDAATPQGNLAPTIDALAQLFSRRTNTGYPLKGALPSQLRQVFFDQSALAAALRQLHAPPWMVGPDRPSKSFPAGGQGLYRFLGGGFYPRPYDVAGINRAAALQRSGK